MLSASFDPDFGQQYPQRDNLLIPFGNVLASEAELAESLQRRYHLQFCHVVDDPLNRLLRINISMPAQLPTPVHRHHSSPTSRYLAIDQSEGFLGLFSKWTVLQTMLRLKLFPCFQHFWILAPLQEAE